MDLDALLAARESDGASGEDVEYDPDFVELQRLAVPTDEKQEGDKIIPSVDPDFKDVETRALAILARSHDLRAAVILAGARLNTKGLTGFSEAIAYIRRCLDQNWDTCYPQLDADDDNDPTMRINALTGLSGTKATPSLLLRYLRSAPLTQSRTFGRLSLRDIQIALKEIPAPAGVKPIDKVGVDAAFADTPPEVVTASLTAVRQAQADMKGIEGAFSKRMPGQGPDLSEAVKMLQQIVRHLSEHAVAAPVAAEAGAAGDGAGAAAQDAAVEAEGPATRKRGGGGMPGTVESPEEARGALDRVIDYFKRYEPSSPVPILLNRAKRLVGADFMTILKDMAPDGLTSVRTIGGLKKGDEGYE